MSSTEQQQTTQQTVEQPTTSQQSTENTTTGGEVSKIQEYVSEFYSFLRDCFKIYVAGVNGDEGSTDMSRHKSFMDYMCYCLYGNFGVKRKIHRYGDPFTQEQLDQMTDQERNWYRFMYGERMNPHLLLQFFYDKSIPSYNNTLKITRLCRHMIFDMASFSIVSLGVIKSLKEDDFYENLSNDKITVDGTDKYRVVVEEFLEGTMIIYNPGMSKFNYNVVSKDEVEETQVDAEEKKHKAKRSKNFTVSTRRKIGTSFFNKPGKTFYEMFQDNNTQAGIDLSTIDSNDIESLCLAFNVEHEDNRIIAPNPSNRNTLVSAYVFKPVEINKTSFAIIRDNMIVRNVSTEDDKVQFHITYNQAGETERGFLELAELMVTEISAYHVAQTMKDKYDIEFRIPQVVEMLENTREEIHNYLVEKVKTLDKFSPGLMVRDYKSTMRFKIRKDIYKELLELKGHTPISIHDKNEENLFKCYWRIRNNTGMKGITTFLQTFDNEEQEYRNLFDHYKKLIYEFTHSLYMEYMTVFVDKKKHAREIPYIYAPLIGDLHTDYKNTKQPTTKNKVVKYVNTMPVYKIYWRLFTPEIGQKNEPVDESTDNVGSTLAPEEVVEITTTDNTGTTEGGETTDSTSSVDS